MCSRNGWWRRGEERGRKTNYTAECGNASVYKAVPAAPSQYHPSRWIVLPQPWIWGFQMVVERNRLIRAGRRRRLAEFTHRCSQTRSSPHWSYSRWFVVEHGVALTRMQRSETTTPIQNDNINKVLLVNKTLLDCSEKEIFSQSCRPESSHFFRQTHGKNQLLNLDTQGNE